MWDITFTTEHIHSWASFQLWPSCFNLTRATSICPPLFLSSILDTFQPGGSSSGVISVCLFIQSIGFFRQEYSSGLSFPSPVDHILSELFTMTHPSWVALHTWLLASLSYTSPFSRHSCDPWKRPSVAKVWLSTTLNEMTFCWYVSRWNLPDRIFTTS